MIRFVPKQDLFRAGAVGRAYVLQDVSLASLDARRMVHVAHVSGAEPEITVEDDGRAELVNDGRRLLVTVQFAVTAGLPKDDETAPIVTVAGSFELDYARVVDDADLAAADLQTFAKINGVYNAWPYIRETVSSLFARLGYPPLTLESLVVAPHPDEANEPALRPVNGNRLPK